MNSGKSMHLLAKSHNFDERGIFHILLKPAIDTRDKGVIHSRSLPDKECLILEKDELPIDKIYPFLNESDRKLDWILIDEAQFLTEEQVNNLVTIVDYWGVSIICYGLRTDSRTQLFEGSKRLLEVADTIEEIKSSCHCGRKTIFNARIDKDGDIDLGGEQILVGSEEKYISLCRKCYLDKVFGEDSFNIDEQ